MLFILQVVGERCIACGLCERMAPHLFTITGDRIAAPNVPLVAGQEYEDACETAAACPVEAIAVLPCARQPHGG